MVSTQTNSNGCCSGCETLFSLAGYRFGNYTTLTRASIFYAASRGCEVYKGFAHASATRSLGPTNSLGAAGSLATTARKGAGLSP